MVKNYKEKGKKENANLKEHFAMARIRTLKLCLQIGALHSLDHSALPQLMMLMPCLKLSLKIIVLQFSSCCVYWVLVVAAVVFAIVAVAAVCAVVAANVFLVLTAALFVLLNIFVHKSTL